jgi:hypothetical protein
MVIGHLNWWGDRLALIIIISRTALNKKRENQHAAYKKSFRD